MVLTKHTNRHKFRLGHTKKAMLHSQPHTATFIHTYRYIDTDRHRHTYKHQFHIPSDGGSAFSSCFQGPTSWFIVDKICKTSLTTSELLLKDKSTRTKLKLTPSHFWQLTGCTITVTPKKNKQNWQGTTAYKRRFKDLCVSIASLA